MNNHYKILLPQRIWDSKNNDEFKQKLAEYMAKSYPECRVVEIEKPYALCVR